MGLLPLEFTDCLQDSPYFRDSLHSHEKELERTSTNIKELIKEVKNLVHAAKNLSRAQRSLSSHLINFKFDCIGSQQTDDELVIAGSLKEFGRLISAIEDERDRMLERSFDNFILPLETFRKEQIGAVKERKKKFDKQTAKFCSSQERYLGLSTKKPDGQLQEADAALEMEQRDFARAALEYVYLIQEVQERKKFEFVETLQAFMYGWLTFYHQGHEVAKDFKPYMTDLQIRVQNTRENFNSSRDDIQALMRKMLEVRQTKPVDPGTLNKMYTRTGYLFCMEKKALGTTWQKCYCQYIRENRLFCMIPYNQTAGKITNTESFKIRTCLRRSQETIDKRFCFDIIPEDRQNIVYTFQAQSEEDRLMWVEALDGREPPQYSLLGLGGKGGVPGSTTCDQTYLNEAGFNFVSECCRALERRGLEDQGMYRVVGVASKVTKLINQGLDRRKIDKINFDDVIEWETKTITSAIKTFLRNLPEPLMSFSLHSRFIDAAKYETYSSRQGEVHRLVHQLPQENRRMLDILLSHLNKVVQKSDKNLMTVSNLGVCFGPTLLRAEEETVAAIMDIKFANVVVEILIQNGETLLKTTPGSQGPPKPAHSSTVPPLSPSSPPSSTTGSAAVPASSPTATTSCQTSPASRPPPYIPPPQPPAGHHAGGGGSAAGSPAVPGGPAHHPTLATAVIFEGPKVHSQASPLGSAGNGPVYATWERTLKGQQQQQGGQGSAGAPQGSAPPGAQYRSTTSVHSTSSASTANLGSSGNSTANIHTNFGATSPSAASTGLVHGGLAATNHSSTSSISSISTPASSGLSSTQSPVAPWYRQNQAGGGIGRQFHHQHPQQHPPLGHKKSSSGVSIPGAPPGGGGLGAPPEGGVVGGLGAAVASAVTAAAGNLSGYDTSTTALSSSSSSSTESLASWSSKDTHHHTDTPHRPQPAAQGRGVLGLQAVELRKVKTLYACVGEHDTELSFEPNQIITSVRPSLEPGWLEGNLEGKVGLVPENYVEYL